MPKMKSNKGASKRFFHTGNGKIRRHKANKSHILTSKTTKRKRGLRKGALVNQHDAKNIARLIPYQ